MLKLPVIGLVEYKVVPDVAIEPKGKFRYVVAEIVLAVNPFVKVVGPDTVPPVKLPPEDGKLR